MRRCAAFPLRIIPTAHRCERNPAQPIRSFQTIKNHPLRGTPPGFVGRGCVPLREGAVSSCGWALAMECLRDRARARRARLPCHRRTRPASSLSCGFPAPNSCHSPFRREVRRCFLHKFDTDMKHGGRGNSSDVGSRCPSDRTTRRSPLPAIFVALAACECIERWTVSPERHSKLSIFRELRRPLSTKCPRTPV
jgi:hypothetical protein